MTIPARSAPVLRLLIVLLAATGGAWPLIATAAEPADSFAAANRLYESGKFAEAARTYEDVATSGSYSANLFYNMGNAYARLDDPGRALLAYERALALDPAHPEAGFNARFLRSKIAEIPPARTWRDTAWAWTNQQTLALAASIAFWIAGFALASIFLFRPNLRRLTLAVLALVVFAYALAGIFLVTGDRYDPKLAVVVAPDVKGRFAPASNAEVVAPVPPGTLVRILSGSGEWTYVSLPDNRRAWLPSQAATPVIPAASRTPTPST